MDWGRGLIRELERGKAGHRPASADRQPALLTKAAILRSRPSSPSPCGSRPFGLRSGAWEDGRPPLGVRRHSRGLATLIACRGAGVRANLPLSLLRRLSGSRRRIRRHAGMRPAGAQAENRPYGPTAFHRCASEPSVFQLAPRYPPSASWGLRRRLRRGWTGEGIASLLSTMMDPALVGPGDLRWPRSRASV